MNETTMRKVDKLISFLYDYHNIPFNCLKREIGWYYFCQIFDDIQEIFPQMQISIYEDILHCKTHFQFCSTKTQNIFGQIDIQCGENVYDALCKIIRFCDDCIEQHTLPRNNDSIQSHHCASCGAALKRNSDKCEYCGTEYW